jgi:ArsR family transcriptional regulator
MSDHHHHGKNIPHTDHNVPDEGMLCDLAELYKIFGDSTRIKILYALFEEERGVGDIADTLGMSMSAISHQLRILKQARLVKSRREGKMVYYSLADDHVRVIFAQGLDHICE